MIKNILISILFLFSAQNVLAQEESQEQKNIIQRSDDILNEESAAGDASDEENGSTEQENTAQTEEESDPCLNLSEEDCTLWQEFNLPYHERMTRQQQREESAGRQAEEQDQTELQPSQMERLEDPSQQDLLTDSPDTADESQIKIDEEDSFVSRVQPIIEEESSETQFTEQNIDDIMYGGESSAEILSREEEPSSEEGAEFSSTDTNISSAGSSAARDFMEEHTKEELWEELAFKTAMVYFLSAFTEVNRATGLSKLRPNEQRNLAIPLWMGSGYVFWTYIVPVLKQTVRATTPDDSRKERYNQAVKKDNPAQKIKAQKKVIKGIEKHQKSLRNQIDLIQNANAGENQSVWARLYRSIQRIKYGIYYTYKRHRPTLEDLQQKLAKSEQVIQEEYGKMYPLERNLKQLNQLKPGFLYKMGRMTRAGGLTVAVGGGVLVVGYITADSLILIFDGEEETRVMKEQFEEDIVLISHLLGVEVDSVMDIMSNLLDNL